MLSTSTTIGPFSMAPDPIRETKSDQVTADNIQMKCTSIPLENPLGINIGLCLPIPNPMGPNDIATDQTNIDEMDSTGISSPQASMKNITALNMTIPSVTTQAFEAQSTTALPISTSKKMYGPGVTLNGDADKAHIDGKLTLKVSKLVMRVKGGLEFTNLNGSVATDSATADKLDLSLVLKRNQNQGTKSMWNENSRDRGGNVDEQKPRVAVKPKLKIEEIAKRERIMKSVMDQKRTGKIDIKATFDLIHLSVYPLLENREIVEDDMKKLKTTLDEAACQICEIIEKSKRKTSNNTPQ